MRLGPEIGGQKGQKTRKMAILEKKGSVTSVFGFMQNGPSSYRINFQVSEFNSGL